MSKEITICRGTERSLSDTQLREIAALIYDTDLYIYPAMFASRQEAETVLSRMIRAGDRMFRTENMLLAMNGTKIAGVLLWIRGPLKWDPEIYQKCGGKAEHIGRVTAEYFDLFAEAPAEMASMVRISVNAKMQGQEIGSLLMDTFMKEEEGPYQLFVLAKNEEAVAFFQRIGYRIRETRPGFSLDYQALPCYWMVKK